MYAVIETGGKQYKVKEGDIIRVELLHAEPGTSYNFDKVLCMADDDKLNVGKPYLEGAYVMASVLGDGKEKKVIIYKYKSKKTFHKKNGHRQPYTQVKIETIMI